MEWNWSSLTEDKMQYYRDLCPDYEYRVFAPAPGLPGISKGLTDKCSMLMIAASGDATGRVFYMANLLRPDPKDKKGPAVDQMPFGFVFDTGSPLLSGALIQHGNWDGRTTYPPVSAWDQIVNGSYGAYMNLSLIPPASAGSIYDLQGTSHESALSTLIESLKDAAKKHASPEAVAENPGKAASPPANHQPSANED